MSLGYAKKKKRTEQRKAAFVGVWDKPTPPRNAADRDLRRAGFVQPHGGGASGGGASDAYILTSLMTCSTRSGLKLFAIWKPDGGGVETGVVCSSREMLQYAHPLQSVEEAICAVSSGGSYSLSSYGTEASNVYLKASAMSAFDCVKERVRKAGKRKRKMRSAKGGGGYLRVRPKKAAAQVRFSNHRFASKSYQAPDKAGEILFRTDKIVVHRRRGRNCTLDAFDFCTGQYNSIQRASLEHVPAGGDVSIRQVSRHLNTNTGKWCIRRLQGHPHTKISELLTRTRGIFIARAKVVVSGQEDSFHYVAFDAFRSYFFVGGADGLVRFTNDELKTPESAAETLQNDFGLGPMLDNLRVIKVLVSCVGDTEYNTPMHYK